MMWFGLSLVAILFWSFSDLFSKVGSKKEDKYSHWKIMMFVGGVMGIHAIVMICTGVRVSVRDLVIYLPASTMYILSMLLGYFGLRYLCLSLSSPICNSSGAVTAILCFVILKQRLQTWEYVGVALIIVGIAALSVTEKIYADRDRRLSGETLVNRKYTHSAIALILPILYCIMDALGTFADGYLLYSTDDNGTIVSGYLPEDVANVAYELTFLLVAVAAFVYVVVIKKQKIFLKKETPKLAGALCETAGQFAYIYAIAQETMAAAPLISSYCVLSLVWARIFLKEKLTWIQYILIAVAAAGIVILGAVQE